MKVPKKKRSILDQDLSNKKYTDYKTLGAQLTSEKGLPGTRFSVWAPHAENVRVVGYFNHWNGEHHQMVKKARTGVWSIFIPNLGENTIYKYEIVCADGRKFHKIDPVAFFTGVSPDFSCRVVDLSKHKWHDHQWQKTKKEHDKWQRPVSIYELHAGSWRRHANGTYYSYIDMIDSLVDYVKCLGYTHIEFMPIMEHPFDGSWGYQCTGYFAPNSRFGSPEDFMYFIDCCHQAEIGVILDWVPSHFCRDEHGLAWYDGAPCYEKNTYNSSKKNKWGSSNFALEKPKVQSFLISSVLFWLEKYHIDGIRVDSVADMFNDSTRGEGVGVKFLKKFNDVINERFSGILTIAEDSSIRHLITDGGKGGIGFTYCWNMGWTHDILKYMQHKPEDRKNFHKQLMFTLKYTHDENFVLALSHDEMAHGRGSLMEKMPGTASQQLKNLKLLLAWQTVHPGKKLLFMGAEIGQHDSWRFDRQLDWNRLKYKRFKNLHRFVKQLNDLYKSQPALWQLDKGARGTVVQASDSENSTVILRRQGWNANDFIIVAANFSNRRLKKYWIGAPYHGNYRVIFSTNCEKFDNCNYSEMEMQTENCTWQKLPYRINPDLPSLSLLMIIKT